MSEPFFVVDTDAILDEMEINAHHQRQEWEEAIAVAHLRTRQKFNNGSFETRIEGALQLVQGNAIKIDNSGRMWVGSSTRDKSYLVEQRPCRCEDSKHGGAPGGYCKHRIAAFMYATAAQIIGDRMAPQTHRNGTQDNLPAVQEPEIMEAPITATYVLAQPPIRSSSKYRDEEGVEHIVTVEALDAVQFQRMFTRVQRFIKPQVVKATEKGILQPGMFNKGNSGSGRNRGKGKPGGAWCGEHQCPFFKNARGWGHKIKDSNPVRFHNATPEQVAQFDAMVSS